MKRSKSIIPELVKLFAKASKRKGGSKKGKKNVGLKKRLLASALMLTVPVVFSIWGAIVMRSSPEEIAALRQTLPGFLFAPLEYFGNRTLFTTDALGWTGHDVVYSYDTPAPDGAVFFAGAPAYAGPPGASDVKILQRDNFAVGWSDSLCRPAWVAYHVPRNAKYPVGPRPDFKRDSSVAKCPPPDAYLHSGFDRGHMAPNHAIASRFGESAQEESFLMTNIAPQTPELNRGIWREIELSIADVWAGIYGEIWVIVGAIPSTPGQAVRNIGPTDVPSAFYMIIVAETEAAQNEGGNEEPYEIRAMGMIFPQNVPGEGVFAMHHLASIDEIEKASGYDFMPALPDFIEDALESDRATRLWPVGFANFFRFCEISSN